MTKYDRYQIENRNGPKQGRLLLGPGRVHNQLAHIEF